MEVQNQIIAHENRIVSAEKEIAELKNVFMDRLARIEIILNSGLWFIKLIAGAVIATAATYLFHEVLKLI